MRRSIGWWAAVAGLGLWSAGAAQAATMVHAGLLLDAGDVPVSGVVSMRFRLWSAAAAGDVLWESTAQGCPVSVQQGRYRVELGGDCGPALPDLSLPLSAERFLEVSVGGVTLSPRMAWRAVPVTERALDTQRWAGKTPAEYQTALETALDARYARLDLSNALTGALTVGGAVTAQRFVGDGSGLTGIVDAALPSTLVRLGADGKVPLALLPTQIPDPARLGVTTTQTFAGPIAATSFTGDGAGITNLSASKLTSGTVPLARLDPRVVTTDASGAMPGLLLGNDTSTCGAGRAGAIRWSGSAFEGCDGTEWKKLAFDSGVRSSCRALKNSGTGVSGTYTIDPDGSAGAIAPFQVYCDMSGTGVTYAAFEQGSKRPLAHWDMESTTAEGYVRDLIGGYHLQIVGNPSSGVTGAVGKTYEMTNTGSFFKSLSDYPAVLAGSGVKSSSAWVYINTFGGDGDNASPVFGWGNGCGGTSFNLHVANNYPYFVGCSTDITSMGSVMTMAAGRWYHHAATYDGSNVRYYVDGVLRATQAIGLNVGSGTSNTFRKFAVGADTWWATVEHRMGYGRVDEPKAYSVQLSDAEVLALYQLNTWLRSE